MARKSRKGQTITQLTTVQTQNKTAVYARLSVEDNGKKDNGESIENQIYIVEQFINNHPDLKLVGVYTDNGETGTNFERPAFENLMSDIKKGKIDCIVVKDLSRFGRTYIETGEYLEKIFPFMGVRFISITDNYDSKISDNSTEGIIIALKNLINDAYAKDISRKVSTAIEQKQKNGEFIGAFAPYGYMKSKDNKNKLVIDEETAPIVKTIFQLKSEGAGYNIVARRLNEQKIPCPMLHRIAKDEIKSNDKDKVRMWQGQGIKMICNNLVYIGHMAQAKTKKALHEHKAKASQSKADWIIVENTHEPLIDIELWNRVQELIQKRRDEFFSRQGKYSHLGNNNNVFKGLVICEECQTKMIRYKSVSPKGSVIYNYICPNRLQTLGLLCSLKNVNEKAMLDLVYNEIRLHIDISADLVQMMERLESKPAKDKNDLITRIAKIQKELRRTSGLRCSLYESYANKLLTEDEYTYTKAKYEQESVVLGEELNNLQQTLDEKEKTLNPKNRWIEALQSFRNEKKVTREMAVSLIEKIIVKEYNKFEIVWKFTDELEAISTY